MAVLRNADRSHMAAASLSSRIARRLTSAESSPLSM
jgi:hypothetical protein